MRNIQTKSLFLTAFLITLHSFIIMAAEKTETQSYRVVRTEKEFEIRFYPPAILATVTSSAKSYKELASPGFRKLASYIFGGNQSLLASVGKSRKMSFITIFHHEFPRTSLFVR